MKEPTKLDYFDIISERKIVRKTDDVLAIKFKYQEYTDYIVKGEIRISLDKLANFGKILFGLKSSSLTAKVLFFGKHEIDVTFNKDTPPKRTKANEIIDLYFLKRHKFLYNLLKQKETNFEKQNFLSAKENENNYYDTDDDLDDDY
jgi:hypothetical protein